MNGNCFNIKSQYTSREFWSTIYNNLFRRVFVAFPHFLGWTGRSFGTPSCFYSESYFTKIQFVNFIALYIICKWVRGERHIILEKSFQFSKVRNRNKLIMLNHIIIHNFKKVSLRCVSCFSVIFIFYLERSFRLVQSFKFWVNCCFSVIHVSWSFGRLENTRKYAATLQIVNVIDIAL